MKFGLNPFVNRYLRLMYKLPSKGVIPHPSGPSASLVPLGRWVIRMVFLAIFFSYLSSKLRNLLGSSSGHHDLLFLSTLLLAAPGWVLRPAERAL